MTRHIVAAAALALAIAAFAPALSDAKGKQGGCTDDTQCKHGRVCVDGKCTAAGCTSDMDCPGDLICNDAGKCVDKPENRKQPSPSPPPSPPAPEPAPPPPPPPPPPQPRVTFSFFLSSRQGPLSAVATADISIDGVLAGRIYNYRAPYRLSVTRPQGDHSYEIVLALTYTPDYGGPPQSKTLTTSGQINVSGGEQYHVTGDDNGISLEQQ